MDSIVVPGSTFKIKWVAAPYAEMAFGGDETFEIICMRRGPDVRTAIYVTQKTDILKGYFLWKVPSQMPEGRYFIAIRKRGFERGDLEYAAPENGAFAIVSSNTDVDAGMMIPTPVKLAARKSNERKENPRSASHQIVVEGTVRWTASLGPWEPGTYEFRYFDAGWDCKSNSLLFVPGRGHVVKSPKFKVEKPNEVGKDFV